MDWIVTGAAQRTWQTFREDWVSLPRPRRARFAWTLTLACLTLCAAMGATALLLRGPNGERLSAREADLLTRLVDAIPIDYGLAIFLESPGNGVILVPLALAAAVAFARGRRPVEAVAVTAAPLLSAVVVGIGWMVWSRERPDFIYAALPASGLSAFPSGHMAMSIPFYGLLSWLWLRHSRSIAERAAGAAIATVLLAGVGAARIVLGAHWPSDMLAGAVIGLVWLVVVILSTRAATGRADSHGR